MNEIIKKGLDYFKARHMDKNITNGPVYFALENILNDYWERLAMMAASKTGKYHHRMENIKPFGMINHLLRTEHFIIELSKEEGFDPDSTTYMIAAGYLHDIGNILVYENKCRYQDHGPAGADMVRKYLEDIKFNDIILNSISNHMHHWCNTMPITDYEKVVAYSDYLASRPDIEINGLTYITEEMFMNKDNDDEFRSWS